MCQRNLIEQIGQGKKCAFAQVQSVLPDGCQRRNGVTAHGDIVKAQDADILRNTKAKFAAVVHDAVGQHIVTANNGGAVFF